MNIVERTVSDSDGNIDGDNVGKICPIEITKNGQLIQDIYSFYVHGAESTEGKTLEVKMVLPVGGDLSGLYRFPRVGEKVLVMKDTATNYLFGYVPSVDTPFTPDASNTEKNKLLQDSQGMVLRYQQTGKKSPGPDEKYSEIGFYHQPTSWKAKTEDDYNEFETQTVDAKPVKFTKIDRINIQSTGDIHSDAQNHYRTQAKRFELLVDCDGPNYTKAPEEYEREDFAFGDKAGDDPVLYAGDAHIRAKNRIVIKAGEEIQLQVGRSSIIISDKGINIVSRKTRSPIENSWDTKINLTPLDGINMFGHRVRMKAAKDFSLADSFGGELTSIMGITRLTSKDFKAQSTSLLGYGVTGLGTIANYLNIIPTMLAGAVIGTGKHGVSQGLSGANSIPALAGMAPDGVALLTNVLLGYLDANGEEGSDPVYDMISTLKLISTIVLAVVPMIVEMNIPRKNLEEYGGRDGLITAVSIVEIGLMTTMFYSVCTKIAASLPEVTAEHEVAVTPFDTSYAHLVGTGSVVLGGATIKNLGRSSIKAEGPLIGYGINVKEKLAELEWYKIAGAILGGLGVAGVSAYFIPRASTKDEAELKELKEL